MKADAFMNLVRTALNHADGGQAAGDDRYLVHLVTRGDVVGMTTLDGRPVHPAQATLVACDAARVAHTVSERGEPLHLGRKTRDWSTAQRRAITVRDGGHCRFVGCHYRHVDIHHIRPWQDGGTTDINNACSTCSRHHKMLHHGYRLESEPNGQLRFYRPDGTYLGSTYPATAGASGSDPAQFPKSQDSPRS